MSIICDINTSWKELLQDRLISRIPVSEREKLVTLAWNRGIEEGTLFFQNHSGSVYSILSTLGIKIQRKKEDKCIGNRRYFAEYEATNNEIVLYRLAIETLVSDSSLSYQALESYILAHELFHYLEHNKIGLTSNLYKVPIIKIGKYTFGQSGIASLSEIGAYAFSFYYYHLFRNVSEFDYVESYDV